LLEKNACSPLEKTNSSEQSRQVSDRSSYTLSGASSGVVALDKPPVASVSAGTGPRFDGGQDARRL
jgi:predicted dienelactone hydrolase